MYYIYYMDNRVYKPGIATMYVYTFSSVLYSNWIETVEVSGKHV